MPVALLALFGLFFTELLDHRLFLASTVPALEGGLHDLAAVCVGMALDITVNRLEQRRIHGNADLGTPAAAGGGLPWRNRTTASPTAKCSSMQLRC